MDGGIFSTLRELRFQPSRRIARITSVGVGCQAMLIDRCNFISSEIGFLPVVQRTAIGVNVNANDVEDPVIAGVRFKHFLVMNGAANIVTATTWFQGDAIGKRASATAG